MRLGEILIAGGLIEASKLRTALDYASSKSIPLGGALRVLKYLSEPDLKRALDAQQALRKGLDERLSISILKSAREEDRSFAVALKKHAAQKKDSIPEGLLFSLSTADSLEETQIGKAPSITPPPTPTIASRPADKLIKQGDQFFEANQLGEAERTYRQALQTLDAAYGTPAHVIVAVLTKLANVYLACERYEDARKSYLRTVDLQSQSFGPNSAQVAKACENLGEAYQLEGNESEAARNYREALDLIEKIPGEIETSARLIKKLAPYEIRNEPSARARLGELAIDAGLLTQAQLEAALKTAEQTRQPLGVALRNSGVLENAQMESLIFAQTLLKQNALPSCLVARALRICRISKTTLRSLCEAGKWLSEQLENDPIYQQLVAEQEKMLNAEAIMSPDDPDLGLMALRLADLHLLRKDPASAEHLFRRAKTVFEQAPQADQVPLIRICDKLAQAYCQNQQFSQAEPLLSISIEMRRQLGRANSVDTAKCLWLQGKVFVIMKNYARALEVLEAAKAIFTAAGGGCPQQLIDDIAQCTAKAH